MKETGYHKAIVKEFEGRVKPTAKRPRMTDAERNKALHTRRRREDIEEGIAHRKEWELC